MSDIILVAINARYIHASFGLRCLRANLGELRGHCEIAEFVAGQRSLEIVERILAAQPRIVGLGVYIWNVAQATEVVALLKRIRPGLPVVLGGPEVSHETEAQEIVRLADHVVTGEADLAFPELCRRLLAGESPGEKIIVSPLPDLARLALPYDEYTAEDISHRLVYVEASRGCPFSCEFCLSSLDIPVRSHPLEAFLEAMQRLLDRGVRHFKFVDRTFNLNLDTSRRILEFFLVRMSQGLFLHFEMVPDRFPEELRELVVRFPPGTLQFEVGVQTFNPEAAAAIGRRQDYGRLEENLRFLAEKTTVHVHADLIAGLPGEDERSFSAGFDRLVALKPQEIQVGILKRLRGTPIGRHDAEWGMVYSPLAPYEILQNRLIDFPAMQRLRRFARIWDLVANSGNFVETTPPIWSGEPSPFAAFMRFSEWYYDREGRHHAIALVRTMERLLEYLTIERRIDAIAAATALWNDYQRGNRCEMPPFLRPHLPDAKASARNPSVGQSRTIRRQERHAGDGISSRSDHRE
ncbi:MAG: DUF4080 domain-containing protein [Opitutaceae bacterium]|jgi:radical SAM superfamily enzyme YgiQ (UPF0313 family)